MKIEITNNFLIFPVNTNAKMKKLTFAKNNKTVYELDIRLDNVSPDFYAHIDVSRFLGEALELTVRPEMEICFTEADSIDFEDLYSEHLRPQVHFTTKSGWLNDPNGLIYIDGAYHLFYQHNPAENRWNNMHWGHAVSIDLIHWEERGVALFPESDGMRYSGSAILDRENLLGKGKDIPLLFFTATNPYSQHIAYTEDNFETFKYFKGNPVVPHIEDCNRDPKVVFCSELDCYVMALYLTEDIYALFTSKDLVNWDMLQKINTVYERECPDFFPIFTDEGEKKWVFTGAHDKYLVGKIKNGKFEPEQELCDLYYGKSSYAGQTFSNLPDNRVVRMNWHRWEVDTLRFNGQMGIPLELKLTHSDRYYLSALPVEEIKGIYKSEKILYNEKSCGDSTLRIDLSDDPQLLKIKGKFIKDGIIKFRIFGCGFRVDFSANEIHLGDTTAPINVTDGDFEITVISDRCSLEIFSNGGKVYMSGANKETVSDRNLLYFEAEADMEYTFSEIEIHSLDSIWSK